MGCSASVILPQTDRPYEEIRFLQSSMRNIDKYFHHLHDTVQLKQTTDELNHIVDGIEQCVRSLLDLVSKKDARFRVADEDLLKVGSFYDGTKLGAADQFDYIAVLSELETREIMIEDLNQPVNGINVKVYIEERNNQHFANMWKDMKEKPYLRGRKTEHSNNIGILDVFFKHLQKVAVFQTPIQTKFGAIEIDPTVSFCKDGPSVRITLMLNRSWHVIQEMKRVEKESVETITINITPAIRVDDVEEFVFAHDSATSAIYNHVIDTGSFLMIPADDGHFKKVFTETEMKLMKELPVRHLQALRVLKYLISGENRLEHVNQFQKLRFRLYDSYAIKMLLIENSDTCPCMSYTEYEVFDCVMHVLSKMLRNLYDTCDAIYQIYPNVFIKSASSTSDNSEIIKLNRNELSDMIKHDLKIWIGEKQKYDLRSKNKRYGVIPLNFKILRELQALNPS